MPHKRLKVKIQGYTTNFYVLFKTGKMATKNVQTPKGTEKPVNKRVKIVQCKSG